MSLSPSLRPSAHRISICNALIHICQTPGTSVVSYESGADSSHWSSIGDTANPNKRPAMALSLSQTQYTSRIGRVGFQDPLWQWPPQMLVQATSPVALSEVSSPALNAAGQVHRWLIWELTQRNQFESDVSELCPQTIVTPSYATSLGCLRWLSGQRGCLGRAPQVTLTFVKAPISAITKLLWYVIVGFQSCLGFLVSWEECGAFTTWLVTCSLLMSLCALQMLFSCLA